MCPWGQQSTSGIVLASGQYVSTVEVRRADWRRTFDEFSAIHEGWLISLEIIDPIAGSRRELLNLPLLGVSADGGHDDERVTISVARSTGEHVSHVVRAPTHVVLERREDGADIALRIDSANGTQAIIHLRAPALPETVDGLVGP